MIIVGDQHYDSNNGNQKQLDKRIKVFRSVLDYMSENNERIIFVVGDMFDNRKHLSLNTIHYVSKEILDEIVKRDFELHILIGNHDIYYKDSREIHSLRLFKKAYSKHLFVYEDETMINLNELNIQVVPWLTKEEQFVVNKKADLVLGHFEFKDFFMTKNFRSQHGIDVSNLKTNTPIISGHYHNHQQSGNVMYLGTLIQDTWNDFKETKGFLVIDSSFKTLSDSEYILVDSYKHLKCMIDTDTKKVFVEGFKDDLELKIDAKLDYNMFKDHKLKIYCRKELAVVKKFIENIKDVCESYKFEILKEEVDLDIEEILEKVKDYCISDTLLEVVEEDDSKLMDEILKEARERMKV